VDPRIPESEAAFARMLVDQGLLTRTQVDRALAELARLAGSTPAPRLGDILVRAGLLSAADVQRTLSHATQATSPAALPEPAEVSRAAPSDRFGKFVRVSRLGAGGMGEVWKAWDTDLGRWIALKFLKGSNPDEVARFKREAQAAAPLSHPNIAAVYEVGDAQGMPFIAMQFIGGRTLAAEPRADRRRLVRLVRDAALGVEHAHGRGVIHRDLKPANIMVEGERVYVLDFGLAKRTAGASTSVSGIAIGTPSYMAPEQARGTLSAVGPRSDVYSLGATLYELLTDVPPFDGSMILDVLLSVIQEDPLPVTQRNRRIDADLETIVMKCLEKDASQRYATAQELADDLTRWLDGEAILAHPPSASYRLRKFVSRRRAVLAAAAAGLVLAAAVAATVVPGWLGAKKGREQAEDELAVMKELGMLWARIVLEKQRMRTRSEDPANVRESLRSAVASVGEFIARNPGRPQGYYVRARGLIYLEEFDAAERDLRESIARAPGFAPGHVLLGRVRLEQYRVALLGDMRSFAARERKAKPILDDAQKHLAAASSDKLSIEAWGLPRTREDDVVETLARFFLLYYAGEQRGEAMRLLVAAEKTSGSEEYCEWLGALSDGATERMTWLDAAIEWLPLAARVHGNRGVILAFLAQQAAARGKADDVERLLRLAMIDLSRAIELNPGVAIVYNNRALARLEAARSAGTRAEATAIIDDAIADCTKAIDLDGGRNPWFFGGRGTAFQERGDYERALEDYERALRLQADYASALASRGNLLHRMGRLEEAMASFNRAIESDATCVEFWSSRGATHEAIAEQMESAGRTAEAAAEREAALRDLAEAIKIDPTFAQAYSNRTVVRRMRGELREALDDANRAVELNPRDVNARVNRGNVKADLRDFEGAIADHTAAIQLNAEVANAYAARAAALVARSADRAQTGDSAAARRDLESALEDYSHALTLKPALYAARMNRGMLRVVLRDVPGAIEDFDAAIRLRPDAAMAYGERAGARLATKDPKGALEDFDRAVQLAPASDMIRFNRGRARHQLGDFDGALEDYAAALDRNPRMPEAYVNRGMLHQRAGRRQAAIADFEKALQVAPAAWPHRKTVQGLLDAVRRDE